MFYVSQHRRIRPALGEILRYSYNIAVPEVNCNEAPATYVAPTSKNENPKPTAAPAQQIQVQEEVVEEIIEVQRRNSKSKDNGTTGVFCFLTLLTLTLVVVLGFLFCRHFSYKESLENYIDIARVELDANNYNPGSNSDPMGGTVILTATDGTKGIISDERFSIMTGQVVCENAGFSAAFQDRSVVGTAKQNLFKSAECPKFIISDVRCNGQEKKLDKCAFKVRYASCNDIKRAVGVVCSNPKQFPPNLIIEPSPTGHFQMPNQNIPSSLLLGGKSPGEGDVMAMNSHMVFGPVCDVSFGYNEAMTVCKENGYSRAKFMSGGSYFQPDTTDSGFAITFLECSEHTTSVSQCYAIDNHNDDYECESGTGAGVICE